MHLDRGKELLGLGYYAATCNGTCVTAQRKQSRNARLKMQSPTWDGQLYFYSPSHVMRPPKKTHKKAVLATEAQPHPDAQET